MSDEEWKILRQLWDVTGGCAYAFVIPDPEPVEPQKWTQIPTALTVAEPQKAVDYEGKPFDTVQDTSWFGPECRIIWQSGVQQPPEAPPAPLHPLQRLSSQPNGFGQSLWRPWE